MKHTKIVATMGPACADDRKLEKMIKAGMNVARLNFSHGTHKDHKATIQRVRKIAKRCKTPVAIMQDLQGPKIRIGELKGNAPVRLRKGEEVVLTTRELLGDELIIPVTYSELTNLLSKDDRVLIDDGAIVLKVKNVRKQDVICRVMEGGLVGEHKGINLPQVEMEAPAITRKDKEDLNFGLENGVDYVALSFVRAADDITRMRRYMKRRGSNIPIIAKIEKPQAVDDIEAILKEADGVMIARGDLGVEMSAAMVPVLQKKIIHMANQAEKPVITATQMLESMIHSTRPTRAEAADVANAIMDGTDAVMLSAETAAGKNPVESVKTMADIAGTIERSEVYHRWSLQAIDEHRVRRTTTHAVAFAAVQAFANVNAKAIVVYTMTGRTAMLVSKLRPDATIYVFTPFPETYRRLALFWGVKPLCINFGDSVDEMITNGERALMRGKHLKKGDIVVSMSGTTLARGGTNMCKVYRLGLE